jgi:hypothetical protein
MGLVLFSMVVWGAPLAYMYHSLTEYGYMFQSRGFQSRVKSIRIYLLMAKWPTPEPWSLLDHGESNKLSTVPSPA